MSMYVENQLGKEEIIVNKAKISWCSLIGIWIKGILLCWLLLIPVFKAIFATVGLCCTELAITNKRVVGKYGVIKTNAMDAPLNKIQNVAVNSGLIGKIFNYGTVTITLAAGKYVYLYIKSPDAFKGALSAQIDQYEEDQAKRQASEMAKAMANAMNNN